MLTVDFRRPANPFATCHTAPGAGPYRWVDPVDGELRSSDSDSLDWLVSRILAHRCSAIVGPHGSGKSSLLAVLEAPLRQRFSLVHRLCLQPRRNRRFWPPSGDACLLLPCVLEPTNSAGKAIATVRAICRSRADALWLIDGLERLGPGWRRVIIRVARARGVALLATLHCEQRFLPVVWRTELNEPLAKRLTMDRLHDWPEYTEPLLSSWDDRWRRSAGNLRELWFQLFDEFETLDRASYASQPPFPQSVF